MEVLELLTGAKKKRGKAQLKNLLELALADGQFDDIEAEYLLSLAQRFNISENELKKLKANVDSVEYKPPVNDREKFDHLHQLVRMMLMDGEIHDREMEICKVLSVRLGLKPELVDDFIKVIGEDVAKEVPSDIIIGKLLKIAQERDSSKPVS